MTSLDILGVGHDVVLELGLVEFASRERFYALVESAGYELTIYLLDAPRDVRREWVRQRNREKGPTYAMEVPDAFFELASDRWDPINGTEQERCDVRVVSCANSGANELKAVLGLGISRFRKVHSDRSLC